MVQKCFCSLLVLQYLTRRSKILLSCTLCDPWVIFWSNIDLSKKKKNLLEYHFFSRKKDMINIGAFNLLMRLSLRSGIGAYCRKGFYRKIIGSKILGNERGLLL